MSILFHPRVFKLTYLFFLCLVLTGYSCARSSSKVDRAKESFEAYIKALQEGSIEKAKHFWNKPETETYEMFDWQWGYLSFRKLNPLFLNYRIKEVENKDNYVILRVEWFYREGKAGILQKDIRYFIEEDGRMVGANAIYIHTRDWQSKRSRHFVYHYKRKQNKPTDALLERMDRFYEKVVRLLQVDYQIKIDYYKCDSTSEVGRLFDMEPSLARSQTINGVVASIQKFVPHEIVHIISYRIFPQSERRIPLPYLDEGLSYLYGGASFFSSELLLSWAKKKLNLDEGVSLDTLIHNWRTYGSNQSAGLISSFVKFLIDTKGIDKFKQLFSTSEILDEQKETLKQIYGENIDKLQTEWKKFVSVLPLEEVKIVDGIHDKEIFQVFDPKGDDQGDGDYTYPKDVKAQTGIFDLTSLKISLDSELVYFQVQFANLLDIEIHSDTTFNGTFTAIAIDTDDKEKSGNTQLFFGNSNFEFAPKDAYEFVIEVSNAGILVYDQDWVWRLLFLKAFVHQNHIKGNEISFAIPQKTIGVPNVNWKIQVLTGGEKGGYINTAYGVGRFMKVGEVSSLDQGGGGTNTNFNPDVYDILTPENKNQEKILNNYDVAKKRKAIIPMINLKER